MKKWALLGLVGLTTALYSEGEIIDQEAIIQKQLPQISANWIVDRYSSPYVGAEDLISFHYLLQKTEDWIRPPHEPPKLGFFPIFGRLFEIALYWGPLNQLISTTQHEVFGHGYYIRTLDNVEVTKYKIKAPFPYGKGGGATYLKLNGDLTIPQLQTVTIGGFDAQAVMAKRLKMKWLQAGNISPRAASLYTMNAQALIFYSLATDTTQISAQVLTQPSYGSSEAIFAGNDLKAYIAILNELYPDKKMSKGKLDENIYFNLLDPMTFYAGLGAPIIYAAYGTSMAIPMIHIADFHFLPNIKVQLAPYGLEYYLENFMLYDDKPIYSYIKTGRYNQIDYYGLGFECENMIPLRHGSLGMILDAWYQPKFMVNWTLGECLQDVRPAIDGALQDRSFGAALSIITEWDIFGKKGPKLYTSLGYKSRGYLQGEALNASPIIRLGLSGEF